MADTLGLQDVDMLDTPAEEYFSNNSIYACTRMSHLSVGC